jgi:isorenieratene synthase
MLPTPLAKALAGLGPFVLDGPVASVLPPKPASIESRLGSSRRELRGAYRGTRDRVDRRGRGGPGVRVVVVGGGWAGIAASIVLAERGVQVTLVEKGDSIGGRAGAFEVRLEDGASFRMERSFPAIFPQYYNVRALLRRVDPELASLRRLEDYPVLAHDGTQASFGGLPSTPPLNLIALLRRTPFVSLADLRQLDVVAMRALLTFDPQKSYAEHDRETAGSFLDRLGLPGRARELLLRVFCHGAFRDAGTLSAAEMMSLLHYHFLGNPEGLAFEVPDEPTCDAFFAPFSRYLAGLGVEVRLGQKATAVHAARGDKLAVEAGGTIEADGVVLALDVRGTQALFAASPDLRRDTELAEGVQALCTSPGYFVLRLFLDRAPDPTRPAYAAVVGHGMLDGIALFDRLEGESRRWALRTGGAVVQLWAFGVPDSLGDVAASEALRSALEELYPELRQATVLHAEVLRDAERAGFGPGSAASRPKVGTPYGNVTLAGDWVKLPFPAALMERAAASGVMAANALLDRWDVRGEPVWTLPPRGFVASLAGLRFGR